MPSEQVSRSLSELTGLGLAGPPAAVTQPLLADGAGRCGREGRGEGLLSAQTSVSQLSILAPLRSLCRHFPLIIHSLPIQEISIL